MKYTKGHPILLFPFRTEPLVLQPLVIAGWSTAIWTRAVSPRPLIPTSHSLICILALTPINQTCGYTRQLSSTPTMGRENTSNRQTIAYSRRDAGLQMCTNLPTSSKSPATRTKSLIPHHKALVCLPVPNTRTVRRDLLLENSSHVRRLRYHRS